MATKKPGATAPSKTTAVATWDEELAKAAAASAKMEESAAGGQFFSIKGGQLTWNDAPIPNSTIGAVILDSVLENVYYEGDYDPDTPQAPKCFAFGRDEKTMAPHKIVVEAGQAMYGAAKQCAGCEMNEFGTADRGKGKACRNVRRVALLAAGTFDAQGRFQLFDDAETFETAAFGFLKIPVTSVKGYASYVKTIAETLKRPPWAVVTKITAKPDAKTQVRVTFEPLMNAPNELLAALKKRHEEAAAVIEFPYQIDDGEKTPPARGKAKPAAKKTARRY